MNELLRQSPLCQVGCATFPEDITSPVSLDDTGPYYWTSRSLHFSCHTGQARSNGLLCTNCQKPSLVQPFSAGQVDLDFLRLRLSSLSLVFGTLPPLSLDLMGVTSTDCATDLPT